MVNTLPSTTKIYSYTVHNFPISSSFATSNPALQIIDSKKLSYVPWPGELLASLYRCLLLRLLVHFVEYLSVGIAVHRSHSSRYSPAILSLHQQNTEQNIEISKSYRLPFLWFSKQQTNVTYKLKSLAESVFALYRHLY
jgi:hypothetical protein